MNKPHTTRLDTNVKLGQEGQRCFDAARQYERMRREYILLAADKARIGLSILESDRINQQADSDSQGVFLEFQRVVDREIAALIKKSPERVRYSVFADWMNDAMSEIEKARREIASWIDNPKLTPFDTETTGIDKRGDPIHHVPITAAACTLEGISLCDITMLALDEKGNIIKITEGASKANHLTDEMIAEYLPLENNEVAVIGLENLMKDNRILIGYNTQFDRDMICRALLNASGRVSKSREKPNAIQQDCTRMVERLSALHKYFYDPSHWLETKDVFVRAIGLEPYPGDGKYTRLEDVARATNALASGENQEHGALADCQLIAKIVRNIRKELDEMPTKPKTAAKGQIPATANPAEIEPSEDQNTGATIPDEVKAYMDGLEVALNDAQEKLDERDLAIQDLTTENRRLNAALETYQSGDSVTHHEARDITWCDLEINGFQLNFTRREGETVDQSISAILDHIRVMQALKANDKITTLRVGLKGDWKPLKGFEKPTNGQKPADDQPSADERPATPKGTQPATTNKPAPAPASKPANTPPQQQPASGGKATGDKKSQLCDQIVRHQIDGQNTYDMPFTLSNGKPADRPFAPSKKDTVTLEKALIAAGYDPNAWDVGAEYDLSILVEWVVGQQIPKSDPPKFYRDNMTFTIQQQPDF